MIHDGQFQLRIQFEPVRMPALEPIDALSDDEKLNNATAPESQPKSVGPPLKGFSLVGAALLSERAKSTWAHVMIQNIWPISFGGRVAVNVTALHPSVKTLVWQSG